MNAVAPAAVVAPSEQPGGVLAAATATIPVSPDEAIALEDAGTGLELEVSLPVEVSVGAAEVASDGTVVYAADGNSADVAVQVVGGGDIRIQTVIPSESAGLQYSYTFSDGVNMLPQEDGSVVLATDDVDGVSVGYATVAAPWAFDAAGEPVDTSYSVVGDRLIQTVTPDAGVSYPIVADPSIGLGTGIYVYYNKTEVKNIAAAPTTDKLKYLALLCAVIPNAVAATGCGLYVYDSIASVSDTFKQASRSGKRVEMKYTVGGLLIGWKPVS